MASRIDCASRVASVPIQLVSNSTLLKIGHSSSTAPIAPSSTLRYVSCSTIHWPFEGNAMKSVCCSASDVSLQVKLQNCPLKSPFSVASCISRTMSSFLSNQLQSHVPLPRACSSSSVRHLSFVAGPRSSIFLCVCLEKGVWVSRTNRRDFGQKSAQFGDGDDVRLDLCVILALLNQIVLGFRVLEGHPEMGWKAAGKLIRHWKILRGDNVMIIRGKDRGETEIIKRIIHSQNRVIVKGTNLEA